MSAFGDSTVSDIIHMMHNSRCSIHIWSLELQNKMLMGKAQVLTL